MDNKAILYGVIGLLLGIGLATYAASNAVNTGNAAMMQMMGIRGQMNQEQNTMMGMNSSMDDMMSSMTDKSGDEFDKAFMSAMIVHHQGAIDMAKQAEMKAKHAEIKTMATAIIEAQSREINQMNAWAETWGY